MSARDVIADVFFTKGADKLDGFSPTDRRQALERTDAILFALRTAGWAVVPVEPTREMTHQATLGVMKENGGLEWSINAAYRAMLKAAQEDSRE